MTSCNLLRLFMRLQKLPRIPFHNGVSKLELYVSANANGLLKSSIFPISEFGPRTNSCGCRFMSSSTSVSDIAKSEKADQKGRKKPKTIEVPKIVLLSETGNMSVVTMEEANKIAKKKSLKIQEVDNPSSIITTDKKVFKLISNVQLLGEDKTPSQSPAAGDKDKDKDKEKFKDSKTLILKSTTSDNDILSKVNSVKKWIEKGHSVRVLIGKVGDKGNAEHVYDVLQEGLKDGRARIVQKQTKGSEMRFQILPPKDDNSKKEKNKKSGDRTDVDD